MLNSSALFQEYNICFQMLMIRIQLVKFALNLLQECVEPGDKFIGIFYAGKKNSIGYCSTSGVQNDTVGQEETALFGRNDLSKTIVFLSVAEVPKNIIICNYQSFFQATPIIKYK